MPGWPDELVVTIPLWAAMELLEELRQLNASHELRAWARDLAAEVDLAIARQAGIR
jgi:hypothetical protein